MKKIPLLESIKIRINEERKDAVLGCAMLGITPKDAVWEDILALVDDKDLYVSNDGFGKETEPHITLLYGIHLDDGVRKQLLDHYLSHFPEVSIIANGVSLFENPGKDYDVLKFDIEVTPELAELNKFLTYYFPFTNEFPDYHPHATIAYIQKGKGKGYIDKFTTPIEFRIKNMVWSEDTHKFTLTKTILGVIPICRERETKKLVNFDSTTYEIIKQ